jgi:hypothetical protein
MEIKFSRVCKPIHSIEIVERKGMGHPEYFSIAAGNGFMTNSLELEFKNDRAYFVSKKEVIKKILGIFPVTFIDYIWINVESGAVELQKPRPWWSFLAF